ncbi:MAG: glycosyltransferase [Candidatus Latescibacteria bacterium]|nr:glycosyltransferase [Candidatus Latescibacterota bacterium]
MLPCYNEAVTIAKVVADFREALPFADVYVFDNDSSDDTARLAREAGAIVVASPRRGKGNVVRHMFATVDADIYVMADGDGTYPAHMSPALIRILKDANADMVVGTRLQDNEARSFRALHEFGNRFVARLISTLFSASLTDVLSGFRVFRRHFVRALYLRSNAFEIETEITLQALVKQRVVREVPVHYGTRPHGSHSKLNTWSDGVLVLKSVLLIFRDYKPLAFFSVASGVCFVLGLIAGWPPVKDYIDIRYVNHVPLALLAAALEVLAVLFLGIGLILNAIKRFHMENQELIVGLLKDTDRNRE